MSADPTIAPPSADCLKPPASRQPPVFLITHEFYPRHGGIATFTEEIARAAAAWATTSKSGPRPPRRSVDEKPWPFRLRRLPLKGTHDLACLLRLMRELIVHRRRLRYATVYLPEPGPMRAMMGLQFIPGFRPRRLVLTFHGSEILHFHRNPLSRWLARRLIRHASRISVLTGYTHRLLCTHFPGGRVQDLPHAGRPALQFFGRAVCPRGGSPANRSSSSRSGASIPARASFSSSKPCRRCPPPSAPGSSTGWWAATSKENYEPRLRDAADRSDLAVRFFGNVPDDELTRIYDRADIFAMTSIDHRHSVEGFGLVYLEAAAHGLPVVAHAVGGVPEAVVDGVTGLLVPPAGPARADRGFRAADRRSGAAPPSSGPPAANGRARTAGCVPPTCFSTAGTGRSPAEPGAVHPVRPRRP